MHTKYTTTVIDYDCPKGMTKTKCPLRQWLQTQTLFYVKGSVLQLTNERYRLARAEYINAIAHMHQLCNACKTKGR